MRLGKYIKDIWKGFDNYHCPYCGYITINRSSFIIHLDKCKIKKKKPKIVKEVKKTRFGQIIRRMANGKNND